MKRIINISEEQFKDIQRIVATQWGRLFPTPEQIIADSTPLHKGHGRLVDADRLEQIQNDRLQNGEIKIWELNLITSVLDAAETVVEADGGMQND